ncbi:chitobiase/beta-hexosaminidase C-terminal domain-containing protein [Bacillus sp. 1663tsa1]|uniref:chitobiase/beta-hexosaminidase C-terminal domain-containing protein n=1 Tax=Bacillus sp. 1663tsa1 TaxID=2953804 RepID=UPI0020A083A7|nr:chitobiase/beta-hexosaminidase C-terminal domain-containing protein [Bacillus sp. 1663tsa1]MCP1176191.1 chitobiase/beta-hexosaminidase C-terminal domain-containing protein [Bacillus sp. 1663tsa1]
MTEFNKKLPVWNAPGIEPPISKVETGWKIDERPPAEYMNYLQNKTYESILELQRDAVHKDDFNFVKSEAATAAKQAEESKTIATSMQQDVTTLKQDVENLKNSGGGGSIPSGVILFEDWRGGESVTIDTGTDPIDTTPPNNVTNLVTSNITGSSVTLNWTASVSSDVSGYEIYNGSQFLATIAETTYSVGGLAAQTSYTFWVKAKDRSGNVATGTSVAATTTNTTPIDTIPPILTITPGKTFTDSMSVSMGTNEAADIYYTIDGTTPTTGSTKYTSAINITSTTTIKAFAKDTSGNSSNVQTQLYTKQVTEAAWVTSGLVNKWDNVVNRVTVTNNGSYYSANDEWTLAFTIKPKPYMDIFSQFSIGSANNVMRIYVYDNGKRIYMNIFDSFGVNTEIACSDLFSDGTLYYHVVVMRDNTLGKIRMFVNDVEITSLTGNLTVTLNSNNLETIKIGLAEGGNTIKNLLYYNRKLSATELTQNYNALK